MRLRIYYNSDMIKGDKLDLDFLNQCSIQEIERIHSQFNLDLICNNGHVTEVKKSKCKKKGGTAYAIC